MVFILFCHTKMFLKSLVIEFRIVRMHVQVGKLIALNVKTIK